jgi:hypothetical protein
MFDAKLLQMGVIDDVLLRHPIVEQLVQSLRQQGFDSHLDIHDGYLTLTIRLFAIDISSMNSTKDSLIDSEPLLRKKKYMQSLLGSRRHLNDADFLTPDE